MSCLFFKNKSNAKRESKSAPELQSTSRRKKKSHPELDRGSKSTSALPSPRSVTELYKEKEKEQNFRVFNLKELIDATSGFNRMHKIGEGGFGSVYKGTIRPRNGRGDSVVVAIKKLNTRGFQGHKEWLAEVQFLGIVNHPNLVKLLGYCSIDGERGIQRLLVYEFMTNRSLEDHIFNRNFPSLPWKTRLQIMLGAAKGLAYLHEGLEVQVIYRDFKTSNVLLDADFNPKLSDFGLAREGPRGDDTHVSTAVVGTQGYAAPEYIETGHLKAECDIYSFGVVLYEIITGRRALDRNRPTTEQKLLDWVKQYPADTSRFSMIIDPRLRNNFSPGSVRKVAKLADSCLKKNPQDRPTMSQIVESLEQALQCSETSETSESSSRSPLVQKGGIRKRAQSVPAIRSTRLHHLAVPIPIVPLQRVLSRELHPRRLRRRLHLPDQSLRRATGVVAVTGSGVVVAGGEFGGVRSGVVVPVDAGDFGGEFGAGGVEYSGGGIEDPVGVMEERGGVPGEEELAVVGVPGSVLAEESGVLRELVVLAGVVGPTSPPLLLPYSFCCCFQ
ncbi:putative serine/threonine-protein kinase PBL19 [Senna tora]|uniref:Putative serine/threonine-protein kinase PBL19 n=1 Tax=Senna tora TaxID=362788 RepID=A0A834W546_9FABA|nr:putative serine/threonine-protein kinase PBL19 [Senna tora]